LLIGTALMAAGHFGLATAFSLRGAGDGRAGPLSDGVSDGLGGGVSDGLGGRVSGELGGGHEAIAVLALVCLLLFVLAWNFSWAGLMLTLAAEILPQVSDGRRRVGDG